MKDKKPYNNKRQRHGYWEKYDSDYKQYVGELRYSGTYNNGYRIGLWKQYTYKGVLWHKEYIII